MEPNGPGSFADRVGYVILRHFNQPHFNIFPRAPNTISRPKTRRRKVLGKSGPKPADRGGRAAARTGDRGGHSGSGRGKVKSAEELDQEMAACFGGLRMEEPVLGDTV